MNSLWTQRMSSYKHSEHAVSSAQVLIDTKIHRRSVLLKKYRRPVYILKTKTSFSTGTDVFLHEARASKYFWKQFSILIPEWTEFQGRKPRTHDITNQLLDIGYHHIANKVHKI